MDSVLFVTWDGGGNVPPALGIAAELSRRGHAVRVLGHPQQRQAIEAAGLRAEEFRHARPWSMLTARSGIAEPLAYAAVFTDRGIGRDLVESVRRVPTDRIVIDGLLLGALHGAQREGLAYSVLVHTLYGVMFGTLTHGPLSFIARGQGLNAKHLYAAADHVVAATLEQLDAGPYPGVEYTGPVLPGLPVLPAEPVTGPGSGRIPRGGLRLASDPLVLVSLSTTAISGQREALQRILDAVGVLPVRAIVTTGPAIEPTQLRAAANTEVHSFVPHAQLMPRASLVITHGGHATAMLALAHGRPLLVMPMNPAFDQPTIARAVVAHGAGLALDKSAGAAEIGRAILQVLPADSPSRIGAAQIAALIAAQGGVRLAADIVLQDAAGTRARA